MNQGHRDPGFLEPIGALTTDQIEQACKAAFGNATELLEEAALLRDAGRCARAFFLAHIACEELGKLPILAAAALGGQFGGVDWPRIDRALRSHRSKIAQALFMDSIVGNQTLAQGKADYEADLGRMRTYTDLKNAALYSSLIEGRFATPAEAVPCDFVDTFLTLARGRLGAFDAMYMKPMREPGSLARMVRRTESSEFRTAMEVLVGAKGHEAYEAYRRTGDESYLRRLLVGIINDLLDSSREAADPEEA
jgi:AbiV family abortive infection protein